MRVADMSNFKWAVQVPPGTRMEHFTIGPIEVYFLGDDGEEYTFTCDDPAVASSTIAEFNRQFE